LALVVPISSPEKIAPAAVSGNHNLLPSTIGRGNGQSYWLIPNACAERRLASSIMSMWRGIDPLAT
jgi:hypothetical protein